MAATRKGTEKRHHPVESICRKIRAIQKREVTSNPIRQIIRYQASGSQSPRAHSKKNLGDLLRIGMAAHFSVPASPFSSSEQVDAFISCPKVVSPRTPPLAPLDSPGNGTCSVTLTSSENALRLRSSSKQSGTPLLSRRRQGMFLNEDLETCGSENCRTFTLDFDSTSGQSSDSMTPQESVVKQLSLNEDEWKLGGDDGKDDVTLGAHGAPGDEPLAGIFHAWDTTCRGSGGVGRILDNLRHIGPEPEDGGLEELRRVLDPENRGPSVGLEMLQATVREWMTHCRSEREGETSRLSSVIDDSVFEPWDSMKSVKLTIDEVDSTPGSLEAVGGASHQQVLEVSDLVTYVAHLHFNKQKLEEENRKFKLAMETLEEANSQLSEDCAELRLQVKSAQQAVMRTNLLKEELEELKMSMSVSEEQKTMIGAQNKQLETENRALVLKIRMLQEENIRNIIDTDRLEKKIEELTRIDTEHQMQLRTYENTLLTKDASIRKKDLRIEELKSTIIDYGSVIENLRGDKNKLAHELQHLQQELIINGIQLSVSGEPSAFSEGAQSLHHELLLATSAESSENEQQGSLRSLSSLDATVDQDVLLLLSQPKLKGEEFTAALQKLHEEISEVESSVNSFLQWVINPEIIMKGKRETRLTEFKCIMQERLNICRLMLNRLGSHKEFLDKEFIRFIEILKKFQLEYSYFRKEFLYRQQPTQDDAVGQEAVVRKKLQEASQGWEVVGELVEAGDEAAQAAGEKAESLQHKLEEAVSERRNLPAINTEGSNTFQILEQKRRGLKTTTESLRKWLAGGQRRHGLLLQSLLDEEFTCCHSLSCTDRSQQPLEEQLKHCCNKPLDDQEGRTHLIPLTLKYTCWCTPLLDALCLDTLTILRVEVTPFLCIAHQIHAICERLRYKEIQDGALGVTRQHKCPDSTGGPDPGADLPGCARMSDDLLSMGEHAVERSSPDSLPQSREHPTLPSPGHTSSTDSTVTSSESGSETLNMASGDLDCKSLCEKEENVRSTSAMMESQGTSRAQENIACQDAVTTEKTTINQEAKEEPKMTEEQGKARAAGDTAVSHLPASTVKSVNFRQSDSTSANEKEVEAEFLRVSLGFKCDWFTLEKRVKLEERSRDLAEENLKKEIANCLKLLESLTLLCEEDNQAQEIIKKLEKSITFLSQCSTRVASRAEMLGAINQESRVSKAVEVMIQHVENLKRMYAKEHAELEELKQVLLQNERSFNPLDDEEDCQIKKRSASLNSKPSSLRRVTIASLPRNIGNVGTKAAGAENNDRFTRRSSSWRILGSKQSEQRPSLHRFISTYSWADGEEEKCPLKTKDDLEPPGEEIVERTRKSSLSEKKNNSSKWDVSTVYDTGASWAAHLKTSIHKVNKALWLSVAFIVLLAALMSFLMGPFFQKAVEAAPTQEGDSWGALENLLWPFTRLRHNGPPPV